MLSQDGFVEQFIQALQAVGETRAIRYEADISCVLIGDNREFPDVVVGVEELFRQFGKFPPAQQASELYKFARECRLPGIPDDYQLAERHLQLSLR